MADQRSRSGPEKGDFLWIKKGLDPKASYIIFEQDLGIREETILDPAQAVYGFMESLGLSWQQVEDPDPSMAYLVIRVTPGEEEKILGRILGYGFPENIVFYIFKANEV